MQLYPERLSSHLQEKLAPIYLVFGDEPFLVAECCDQIRQAARAQGFSERQRFTQDKEFSWDALFTASQTLSLFTEQQVIELELPDAKPGRDGSQALAEYANTQTSDQLLLLFGPNLRKDQQNSKWFKALVKNGVFVPIYRPNRQHLPKFVVQRANAMGLHLAPDAVQQLCDWYEGNLLALNQALQKLSLLHCPSAANETKQPTAVTISLEEVRNANHDSSRFDVFSLREAIVQQRSQEFMHCLQRLFETGSEPVLIHWVLQRLHFALANIRQAKRQQQSLQPIWSAENIWQSQQDAYLRLAQTDSAPRSAARIHLLERLEYALKRDSKECPKTLACHIGLLFFPEHSGLGALEAVNFAVNNPLQHIPLNESV
ncbi:DNA polymerase III subunit delta [Aliidiomarina sp.]|uniref:DNA polymerase III subunit delta n=1 Tax=Aliidiomarina sp. TaxID=1872439 RepID=UPI003A4E38DE